MSPGLEQVTKGTFRTLAEKKEPKMMGQMLKKFFPKRENPAISPRVDKVPPFSGSPARYMTRRADRMTSAELTSAAPTPPRAT